MGLLDVQALCAVGAVLAQVVKMGHRDTGQTLIAGVAIDGPGTVTQVLCGGPGEGVVEAV